MATKGVPLDVSRAIEIATESAKEYYKDEDIRGLRLEEVEYDEGDDVWLVTLGFVVDEDPLSSSSFQDQIKELAGTVRRARVYKVFTIFANNGAVKSMKMRSS